MRMGGDLVYIVDIKENGKELIKEKKEGKVIDRSRE